MEEHARPTWLDTVQDSLQQLYTAVLTFLPQVMAALLVLIVGWLVALVLRLLVVRTIQSLDWFLPRILPGQLGRRLHRILQPRLLGGIVFWLVLLAFIASAAQVLGLTVFSTWLATFFTRLPQILLAVFVLVASLILSQLAREAIIRAAGVAGLAYRHLLGLAVQSTVLITAAVISLDLLGLDITFLVVLGGILTGAVCGGAALAFGLGSQQQVSNLLGMQSLQGQVKAGDWLRIGQDEGQVQDIGTRSLTLETPQGLLTIPGHRLSSEGYQQLIREDGDERDQ